MIGDAMPERFGLVLDGWTHGTEHYMAAYGCFKTAAGPQYPLLSLAPVINEPDDQLNVEGHLTAIKRFLPFFAAGEPTWGAANRLRQPPPELGRARLLGAPRQRSRRSTATYAQNTRWSSTFSMLKRYFRLREFISADDEEPSDFLPSRSAHRKLEALLSSLRDVESVSMHLQSDGLTLLDARVLFDELLKSHPSFTKYLTTDADIVHSAVFEQAAVKVLDDHATLLTDDEVAALKPFKRTQADAEGMDYTPVGKEDFAVRTLKRRKIAAAPTTYELLEVIPPTSNLVERLFSVARAVLRHERHRLSPMMLEMILFLKINSSYWDVATVEQCL
ncbi:hypothetical protein ON010_g9202 [Phytophthora cinnamomi]|nr:hypothetical protein ON010_g9202 [Phytophthora cinnamomi]